MEHHVFLDIETIPSQSPEIAKQFRDEIKPPGSIKKAESIEKWLAENADNAAAEALAKTSFDPAYGHICTIGWAFDDGAVDVAHACTVEDEANVLRTLFADLYSNNRYVFVGHFIGGFDLRFILCRAVVLGVQLPPGIPRDPTPWDKRTFDTMQAWAGAKNTISMDKLCKALGLTGKGDFDGSMVAEAWANGEHERIVEYCESDVESVRAVFRRFQAVGW